ncbi:hypothetical protein QVD17_38555 [Tagetes erecta]|uniref:Uncharacterized protein n=1 Tax=Tagetes erecta TaxID=13708 RepID=A0AAD8JSC7_TARER|nr:hypothetical protein QVD17_38555 [Tagetes erecta]
MKVLRLALTTSISKRLVKGILELKAMDKRNTGDDHLESSHVKEEIKTETSDEVQIIDAVEFARVLNQRNRPRSANRGHQIGDTGHIGCSSHGTMLYPRTMLAQGTNETRPVLNSAGSQPMLHSGSANSRPILRSASTSSTTIPRSVSPRHVLHNANTQPMHSASASSRAILHSASPRHLLGYANTRHVLHYPSTQPMQHSASSTSRPIPIPRSASTSGSSRPVLHSESARPMMHSASSRPILQSASTQPVVHSASSQPFLQSLDSILETQPELPDRAHQRSEWSLLSNLSNPQYANSFFIPRGVHEHNMRMRSSPDMVRGNVFRQGAPAVQMVPPMVEMRPPMVQMVPPRVEMPPPMVQMVPPMVQMRPPMVQVNSQSGFLHDILRGAANADIEVQSVGEYSGGVERASYSDEATSRERSQHSDERESTSRDAKKPKR